MQRNRISFKGQKIFIGIDVHKNTWQVTTLTETGMKKTHPQKASAKELYDFLNRYYPEGDYIALIGKGIRGSPPLLNYWKSILFEIMASLVNFL